MIQSEIKIKYSFAFFYWHADTEFNGTQLTGCGDTKEGAKDDLLKKVERVKCGMATPSEETVKI